MAIYTLPDGFRPGGTLLACYPLGSLRMPCPDPAASYSGLFLSSAVGDARRPNQGVHSPPKVRNQLPVGSHTVMGEGVRLPRCSLFTNTRKLRASLAGKPFRIHINVH